jgi:phosphomannomutase
MAGIFKAYDIRGIYGDTLTDELMYDIGRAFITFTGARTVVIGRDIRPHSVPLFKALAGSITTQGADVIDLGLCSSPLCYFANGKLGADAGIMITASHNPPEWNGAKLCRAEAIPISGATGILDIERIVDEGSYAPAADVPGTVTQVDAWPDYIQHVRKMADVRRPVRIAADMANAMGIMEAKALEGILEVDALYADMDGSFPNHEANPLKAETMASLQKKVRAGNYDFGVAFDGDADRAGFVDEKGNIVSMDMMTALIAQDILAREKGVIFYDLRSSWSVREVITECGGKPMMSRVGHAFIKQQMRDNNAIFAGELSGHYYFRDNYFTESTAMAILSVANIVSNSGKSLSELVEPLCRYASSGEINSRVPDPQHVLEQIKQRYADGKLITLDGVSVEYEDWWFNVRTSNTEPLIRLNLEARTQPDMERRRDELLALIRADG